MYLKDTFFRAWKIELEKWQGKSTVVGTRIAGQILYLVGIVEMYIWYFISILC